MKKIITIAVLALGIAVSAAAQPKAIGGRLGGQTEVSYQHYLGSPNFIEATLGADLFGGFGALATATYNFTFAQPDWTSRGDWAWYAGPGIATGWVGDRFTTKIGDYREYHYQHGFMVGLAGQVGLSYTFWFPLQLSVSIRPILGVHINGQDWTDGNGNVHEGHVGIYNHGFTWNWTPTLSVHYAF